MIILSPMYDVAIVGAGPAGSSAAYYAARRGLNVLLIDRKLELGVPVKCGEFFPAPDEARKLLPDLPRLEELFSVVEGFVVNRTKLIRFVYPGSVQATLKFEGLVLERKLLDKYLARKAAEAGAEIWLTSVAKALTDKGVLVARLGRVAKADAKIAVGADGALSRVGKWAGMLPKPDPLDYSSCLQYEMARVESDEDEIQMYFGREYCPGGYAWIIPKGGGIANVGLGIRTPYAERGTSIRDYLSRFLRRHPVASQYLRNAKVLAVKAGLVPVGAPLHKTCKGNLLLVGDAARHVIQTIGAGIPTALAGGRAAGEAIADNLLREVPLSGYEKRWRCEIGGVLERAVKLRRLGDIFYKSDKVMEFAVSRWDLEEVLTKFIYCKYDRFMSVVLRTLAAYARLLG